MPYVAGVVVSIALAWQAAALPPILGPAASRITSADVTAITRAVGGDGTPWLLNVSTPVGSIGVNGGDWLARAYLPPTIQTVQLRRGRVMSVVNRTWPSVPIATGLGTGTLRLAFP